MEMATLGGKVTKRCTRSSSSNLSFDLAIGREYHRNMKILKSFRFRLEPTTEQTGCRTVCLEQGAGIAKGRPEAGYPLLFYVTWRDS